MLSPDTEHVSSAVVQVSPPGVEVTVYEFVPTEATHATVARPSAPMAVTPVGASGGNTTASGIAAVVADEGAEVPEEFVAVTLNV